jgi:hypothetical protein
VLRHYTPRQQATVVRGAQRAGKRVADRGALQPRDLAALGAVRKQQERAANRRYAQGFNRVNRTRITPQQAGAMRRQVSSVAYRGHAPDSLFTRVADALNRTSLYGDLINPLAQNLAQQNQRLTREGTRLGAEVGRSLRGASSDVRAGRGSVGAVTPGFLRGPTAAALGLAAPLGAAIPRVTAGALGDVGQYTLGAIPATALLAQQAIHDPAGAVKSLEQGMIDPVKHPLDHPLFALAILHGGVRGVSRAAGAAGRSPLSPAVVRRALTTQRVPLQIGGPGNKRLVEYRHYSKDPLVKAVQVLMDRKLPDGAMIRDQHGRSVRAKVAAETRLASMLGADAAHRLRKFADHTADRANSVERANRALIQHELVKQLPTRRHAGGRPGQAVGSYVDRMMRSQPSGPLHLPARAYRPERDVAALVMTRVIRSEKTFKADLEKRLSQLVARERRGFDNPKEREANLAAPDHDPARAGGSARDGKRQARCRQPAMSSPAVAASSPSAPSTKAP